MTDILTLPLMQQMWPHGDQHVPGLLEGIVSTAPAVLAAHALTSPLAIAIMMAQFSEECGAGLEMVENLNYSAQGLLRTWPRHFTGSMAVRYAHNPQMIGEVAYGGRMGNAPPPAHDGYVYRGRGFSQTTGKSAYLRLGQAVGLPLVDEPQLVNDPEHAFECAVIDFVTLCGCLPFAAQGDVIQVTEHLNGGLIGLADRQAWTRRWRAAMKV